MTLIDLIQYMTQHDIRLSAEGEKPRSLLIDAPSGTVTPEAYDAIIKYKSPLLRDFCPFPYWSRPSTPPSPPHYACRLCLQPYYWQPVGVARWICATCHPPCSPSFIGGKHEAPEPAPGQRALPAQVIVDRGAIVPIVEEIEEN
jgi:hypothetical protein